MKKKNSIVCVLVLLMLLVCILIRSIKNPEGNIECTINTALRIQYGWSDINNLKKICTKEFIENTNIDDLCLGRRFYSIDKNYMENIQEISENEVVIFVNVYSPDIIIHKFTLIKKENNEYMISQIELDI